MVCLETPAWFGAVGQFYVDFRQTSDDEVVELLCRGARAVPVPADGSPRGDGPVDEEPGADAAAEQTGHATDPTSCPDSDGRPGQQVITTLPPPGSGGDQH
jgi:putative phosphoribosyl transferase